MNYIEYFKNKPGFRRLILILKKKYQSTGKFTGVIKLNNITLEEQEDFSKFFGENFSLGDNVSLSLKKFEKVIANSKFEAFNYYDLVTSYLEIPCIKTNKEIKQLESDKYLKFIEDLLLLIKNEEIIEFLKECIISKSNLSKNFKVRYTKNKEILKDTLLKIDKLWCNKPMYPTSLPMYASITGNPHFLDFNTSSGSLFMKILGGIYNQKLETNEEKWCLLERINVLNDTISNYTLTNNLLGSKEIVEFNKKYGPLNLNIDNILKINSVKGLNNRIYIFENPSILNYFKNESISIIITSGIPNLSFYRLLGKIDNETEIYYNGDFDPEGLLIANKLKLLYPKVHLICYGERDYLYTNPSEKLTSSRLKKLEHITVSELKDIKDIILENKKSGYQENNLKNIEEFIKNKH